MTTPSEQLAALVFDRLAAEKLVSPDDRKKILGKLGDGSLKQEDWKLALELAADKKVKS